MSMKPGATICPEASISRCASRSPQSPTAVMRPFLIATSARRAGVPFPSITCPPRINKSSIRCSSIPGPMAGESTRQLRASQWLLDQAPLAAGAGSDVTPSGGMGLVYARTASSPAISMPVTKLRMKAFRSGMMPSWRNSWNSATSPLISMLVDSSAHRCRPAEGIKEQEVNRQNLVGARSARMLDAEHSPSNWCVLHYAFVTHT